MAGRHRTFNGKQYFRYRVVPGKTEAKSLAKELRESGKYLVRVVAEKDNWSVYCLKK